MDTAEPMGGWKPPSVRNKLKRETLWNAVRSAKRADATVTKKASRVPPPPPPRTHTHTHTPPVTPRAMPRRARVVLPCCSAARPCFLSVCTPSNVYAYCYTTLGQGAFGTCRVTLSPCAAMHLCEQETKTHSSTSPSKSKPNQAQAWEPHVRSQAEANRQRAQQRRQSNTARCHKRSSHARVQEEPCRPPPLE
jgi:hypothetical protein